MNNGHGKFTSQDAADYIAAMPIAKMSAVVICSCGAEVEAQPMKAGVCYDCYRNPIDEAQAIERKIDAVVPYPVVNLTIAQADVEQWQNETEAIRRADYPL